MPLIDELIETGYLRTPSIIKAFRKIKRKDFILPTDIGKENINTPLPIGYGQTISQPLTVAFMLELLQPKKGDKILDVGSGSGWTSALLGEIVGPRGRVYGVEIIPELKDFGEYNANKYNFVKKGIVNFFCADGNKGLPKQALFDKILVSAAAESVPRSLLNQLKVGGEIVAPIGKQTEAQDIVLIKKKGKNKFQEKRYFGFMFVPLVKKYD